MPPATWCRWGGPAADWSDVDQSDDALTVTGGGLRTFHSMRFATELRRRLRGTDRGRGRSRSGIQVKAWEETRTFVEPQHPSYRQADPHVWFAAAGATQRGGFRGHREAADRVRLCREPWSGHLGLTASMWAWPWLLSLRRGGGTEVGRAEQVVRRVPYQRVLRDLEPGDVYEHVRVQQAPSRVVVQSFARRPRTQPGRVRCR